MGSRVDSFVDSLHVGAPVAAGGVIFYPLLREGPDDAKVILLDDAIQLGLLEVRETGTVAELEAVNKSDQIVLALEGDIVQGGRQNRVINTTFAIPSKATVKVPASCVERGRWHGNEKTFTISGFMVSPLVKSSLKRSVSDSVRMTEGRSHASDQGAVWERTTDSLHMADASSHTEDHLEAYRAQGAGVDKQVGDVVAALAKAGNVAGVAVVRADKRAAVEAFGTKSIAAKVLPRVVRAHLLTPAVGKVEEAPSRLLEDVKGAKTTSVGGAGGVGEEVRLSRKRMSGLAFLLDAVTVHLSADWSDDDDRAEQKTVIMRRPDLPPR